MSGYADGCDVLDAAPLNPDGSTKKPEDVTAFFMTWEGNSRLFSYAMADGPMPEHYEPVESPMENRLHPKQQMSPCALYTEYTSAKLGDVETYPIAATTYSVVEHWQTGGQSRSCPVLVEAMPEQFIEISKELAAEKGISNGDYVRVWNNRGSVVLKALVTARMKPFQCGDKLIHQVGMTHHFSWTNDYANGDTVNDITPNVGDPTSYIPETKAFLVDIEKSSRSEIKGIR